MDKNKRVIKLLLLAIISEMVIMTDSIALFISGFISENIVIKRSLIFLFVYVFWCTGIVLIRNYYKKQTDIQFKYSQKPSIFRILVGVSLLIVTIAINYDNWGGFKVVKELMFGIQNGGIVSGITFFVAQYLYYFLEVILMVMIISFAQEAGTILWGKKNIPYGGIVLAIIWGLIHIAYHGAVDGLTTTVCAVLFGCAF